MRCYVNRDIMDKYKPDAVFLEEGEYAVERILDNDRVLIRDNKLNLVIVKQAYTDGITDLSETTGESMTGV